MKIRREVLIIWSKVCFIVNTFAIQMQYGNTFDLYKQFSLYDYSKYTTSIISCFKQIFFYAAINHEKRWIDFCKR